MRDDTKHEIDYYAIYSQNYKKYKVRWIVENEVVKTDHVTHGGIPSYVGAVPAKTQTDEYTYSFEGWKPEIGYISENKEYTAQFKETRRKYRITFVGENDTVLQSEMLEYGSTPVFKGAAPAKEDPTGQYEYTFMEWINAKDQKPISTVSGEATYKALYSKQLRQYEIRWVDDDGTLLDKTKAAYGSTPDHDGLKDKVTPQYTYTFKNWDPVPVPVTAEATYKAVYEKTINKYKISFIDHSGTIKQIEADYGTAIKDIRPEDPAGYEDPKAIYSFLRWDPEISMVKGDQTFTAVYDSQIKRYRISFDINGAESDPIADQLIEYDGNIRRPADPSRSGKDFAGWFINDVKWDFNTRIKGELTLKAQWIERSHEETINGVKVSVALDDLQGQSANNRYNDKPLLIIAGNGVIVIPAGLKATVSVPRFQNSYAMIDLTKLISLTGKDHMYGIYLDVEKSDIHENIIRADRTNGYSETINSGFTARFMEIYDNEGSSREYDYPGRVTINLDLKAMNITPEDGKAGYVRTHLLAHNCSGSSVEYLGITISPDKSKGSFSVTSLSPFALVYKDSEKTKPVTPDYIAPRTGDR